MKKISDTGGFDRKNAKKRASKQILKKGKATQGK